MVSCKVSTPLLHFSDPRAGFAPRGRRRDVGEFSDSSNRMVRWEARAVISTEMNSTGVSGVGGVVIYGTLSPYTMISPDRSAE